MGWDSTVGKWARVEGTPSDPNPNDPYAKIDSETLFRDGKLTPSITILGKGALTLMQPFTRQHFLNNVVNNAVRNEMLLDECSE